jgi:hypothetical protein
MVKGALVKRFALKSRRLVMKLPFLNSRSFCAVSLAVAVVLPALPTTFQPADTSNKISGVESAQTTVVAQYSCPNGRC